MLAPGLGALAALVTFLATFNTDERQPLHLIRIARYWLVGIAHMPIEGITQRGLAFRFHSVASCHPLFEAGTSDGGLTSSLAAGAHFEPRVRCHAASARSAQVGR